MKNKNPKKSRFDKLSNWVAEKQSPQAPNIDQIKPEIEAGLVDKFRKTMARKKGKSLFYENE